MGAIGIDAWKNYENSKNVPEVDFDQGYKQTYTHKEYAVDFGVERKDIADNNFVEVFRVVDRIGDSASLFRETEAASIFNNAFTVASGADGTYLCSDSHPLSPQKTGVTQDNNFALALTKANVRTVREAMMAFTDDNGNKMGITPNMLLVPPALEDDAIEIVNSTLNPDNANNTINPLEGSLELIVWPYLTDTDAWFLTTDVPNGMKHFVRAPLTQGMDGDFDTGNVRYKARERYSFGVSDPLGIYGSQGA